MRVPAGLVLSCSSSPGLEIPLLTLGKTLVLPLQKKDILKAPVVILQCSRQLSIYFTVEQVFKADFLSGADRFWKLVRHSYDPPLETWRPRVNGQQLKALSKVFHVLIVCFVARLFSLIAFMRLYIHL